MTSFRWLLWVLPVVAPLAVSLVFYAFAPETVALHFNFSGEVDRYGDKLELLALGGIMSACNLLMALCYAFANQLFVMGLMNAKSPSSGRAVLIGSAIFIVVVTAIVLAACIANTPLCG